MDKSPIQTTYTTSLAQAGLSYTQATVYEVLLKNGPLKAGKVAQKTPLKRGLVYKVLDELVALGLTTKKELPGKVAVFEPEHPAKLKDFAEKQEAKAKTAQLVLDGVLGQLISDFNLISGKPGIQFFEGAEGTKKVADDSLTATSEILSYIDNEAVNKYLAALNKDYISKRNKLKIPKRMIAADSAYLWQHAKTFNKSTTQVRVIASPAPFATIMQIYNNKVSYISLDEKQTIGIIIDDPHIAQMHKTLFEALWLTAKPLATPPASLVRPLA